MKLLSFTDVQSLFSGRSRSSIYRDIEAGRLPKPFKFSGRLYWHEKEILNAINALTNQNTLEAAHA